MREDEYGRIFETEDSFWWYVGIRSLVERSVRKFVRSDRARLLDAGCGTGGNLVMLGKHGDAYGVDLSPRALAYCRDSRGIGKLARGSLETLPFRSDSFDAAISIDVLYHLWIKDDETALKELHRILKPGGVLIIQNAAFEWLRGQHDDVVYTRKRYTRKEVCSKLHLAGFKVRFATYRNTILFPVVVLVRMFKRKGESAESDVSMPGPLVNSVLSLVMKTENFLLRLVRFPFGSSVYAIATKESA